MEKSKNTTAPKKTPRFVKELAKKYTTPKQVQEWIHSSIAYHKDDTVCSAEKAIKKNRAHCLEGAFVAALILEQHGYPPLVMSFESVDEVEHVVFVFKKGKYWGAVGQSRDKGLHGRAPKFKTLRGLAWSYFDPYIDETSRITAYQIANLDDLGVDWRFSNKDLWDADNYLVQLPHRKMKSSNKRYRKMKRRHITKGPLSKGRYWW